MIKKKIDFYSENLFDKFMDSMDKEKLLKQRKIKEE